MSKQILQFELWGKQFFPKVAEEKTGLELSSKVEPGQIGEYGRYKNKPTPYGAEDIQLDQAYYFENQCNLGFSAEELKRIADLEIDFSISCYQVENKPAV